MRMVLILLFAGLALWRAVLDWQATISEGYAYEFTKVGGALAEGFPDTYQPFVQAWENTSIPYLWDPVGQFFLSLPITLVLLIFAGLLWVTRSRGRGRG